MLYFLHLQITSVAENVGVTWFKNRPQDATRKMSWINDPTCFCSNEYLQPYYSKHHGAEKWDLEFLAQTLLIFFSNTTRKNWKLTRRMILHAFVWLSICSHIFPQMYSLFPQWRCVSSGFMEKENICDTQQLGFVQPKYFAAPWYVTHDFKPSFMDGKNVPIKIQKQ